MLINGKEKVGIKKLKTLKAFVDYSQTIDDVYENLEDYNPTKKRIVATVFNDMIADMDANKKLNSIVTELFLRGRKIDIYLAFLAQSYFKVHKTIRINATHCFIMKIPNSKRHQQIASSHSYHIDFRDFMNLYRYCTKNQFSLLVNNKTLSSDNPLRFRNELL